LEGRILLLEFFLLDFEFLFGNLAIRPTGEQGEKDAKNQMFFHFKIAFGLYPEGISKGVLICSNVKLLYSNSTFCVFLSFTIILTFFGKTSLPTFIQLE